MALSAFQDNNIINIELGGQHILLAWFPEYETLGVFSRKLDGRTIDVTNVDVYGESNEGKLNRLPQYPHVFWMIWSHWYPESSINS